VEETIMTAMTLDHRVPSLTRRERVILANLTEDATLEQIARRLYVTRNTVKTQVRSVYRKLGVSSRAEAIAKANEFQIAD
jgi:DNA-binding CsgD family transcriptional regulator